MIVVFNKPVRFPETDLALIVANAFGNGKRNFMVLKTRPTEALFGANKIVCSAKTWSEKQDWLQNH